MRGPSVLNGQVKSLLFSVTNEEHANFFSIFEALGLSIKVGFARNNLAVDFFDDVVFLEAHFFKHAALFDLRNRVVGLRQGSKEKTEQNGDRI